MQQKPTARRAVACPATRLHDQFQTLRPPCICTHRNSRPRVSCRTELYTLIQPQSRASFNSPKNQTFVSELFTDPHAGALKNKCSSGIGALCQK